MNTASKRLNNKVAIITGAGSSGPGIGNGKAAAILYAREGARVLLVDLNVNNVLETQKTIEAEGYSSIFIDADVTTSNGCKNVVGKCLKEYGKIDILHNNVGIEIAGKLTDLSEEDWDKTMTVNLKSVFLMCKNVLPQMETQKSGSIINISSVNSIRTLPAISGAYGASKAAINALTREIAAEYAPKGIRANAILPGMMNTPFVINALTDAWGGDVQNMMHLRDQISPTGKQGTPWDVAYTALFLASDESKYITGTTIIVDGGLTSKTNSQTVNN